MLSYYLQYLPILIAAAVFAVVGALCFVFSQRALEHSRKSLSWIKRHGKKGYPFARNAFPDQKADWLGVFGVGVFALVTAMLCTALRAHELDGVGWLSGLFAFHSLVAIMLSVAGTVAMYYLLQRLFGSTLVSACGSLLLASSYVGAHTAGMLLALSLLLFVLWLTAKQESGVFPAELLYYAAVLLLALTIALRPQLLPVVLLYAGLHLYKHIFRLRHDRMTGGAFALAIVLALVVWVLGAAAFVVGRIVFYYGFAFDIVRERFLAAPLTTVCKVFGRGMQLAVRPLLRSRALHPLMDAPLTALGGFGVISALLLYLRRKDPRATLTLLVVGTLVLSWLLSGESVLFVGLTLSAALLFSNFARGGKKAPVVCVTVLGIGYYLAMYFFAHHLPMVVGILERLS